MRVLSLFDGISCAQVALKKLNIPIEIYYASEIDKQAINVTQRNFPDTVQLGDVTHLTKLPQNITLLTGGSPCQSLSKIISVNNQQLNGKSRLFWEFIRIKNIIQPKYYLFENVIPKSDTLDIMTEALGNSPVILNSELFSAQSRPRAYWTNIPLQQLPQKNDLVIKDILDYNVSSKYFINKPFTIFDENKSHCGDLEIYGYDMIKRIRSINFKSPTLTAVCGGNQHIKIFINGKVRRLTPQEYEKLQGLDQGYTSCLSYSGRYKAIGNSWQIDTIKYLLQGIINK